jgi:ribosome-associated toxin RatA of RatAB toxin-antitoxin module
MIKITRQALLRCSAEQLYLLINDIEAYPNYMDGCVGARIIQQDAQTMDAELQLAKAGLNYRMTTRNQLVFPESVTMTLIDGPLSNFHGGWHIQALQDTACKVTVDLQFTINNRALAIASKLLFQPLADNLVNAVTTRAKQLYG